MKHKALWASVGMVIFLVGVLIWINTREPVQGKEAYEFTSYASNVIGSRTGSSTLYASFGNNATGSQSATSSYVSKIGGNIDQASYTAMVKEASSTANLQINFLASNDDFCDTTSSTPYSDVGTSEINWFDISGHLLNLSTTQTFYNTTSTMVWNTSNARMRGKEMTLTNLNFQCLKVEVSGASTTVMVQIRTK